MPFEWHEGKRLLNIEERGIDFVDVIPLFANPDAVSFEDTRKDYGETRYILLCPVRGLLFQVAYTVRGENIRIISARRGNKRERRLYAQRKND
ncbi:MAG: BrnT family toxin [Gammaproteobacteria bacterium]|jgi:uncharacterized DUF497 family protein